MKQIPAFPQIPEGDVEVRAVFGDLRKHIRADGTLAPSWEAEQIVRIPLPKPVAYAYGPSLIRQITVHRVLAEVAVALYASIFAKGLHEHLGPYGGGFVYRPNANNRADISLHAYGIAWDWDPAGFPNRSAKRRHPELAAEFLRFGFLCGEDFRGSKDPMHFQFALGT